MPAAACTSSAVLRRRGLALLWLAIVTTSPALHAARVTVYTNATVAPLFINKSTGLYPEMVSYLNQLKIDGIEFALVTLPRKRLQAMLDQGRLDGIVIGLMPQWVGDPEQEKFLWTEPFSQDSLVLVSSAAAPASFEQAPAPGRRIGLTYGFVYPGLDQWIARNQLAVDYAPTEQLNLDKLAHRRVDMIVVTESVYRYYLHTHPATPAMSTETLPGQPTERRFLLPKSKRALYGKLAPAIHKLRDDPRWQRILSQY